MASGRPVNRTTDVVVIGGGPGGSAAATMLARKGFGVLLLERERFPRDHVGESLLPASIPVLEELGVSERVREAAFLPKWGATMVWGRDKTPWSWYFRETSRNYPHSYQVWRPQFDEILLDNSRANGVDAREGCVVTDVLLEDGGARGVRWRSDDAVEGEVSARFVVDASGQSALIGRKLQLRHWDDFFQNLAVYGYFQGSRRLPPPDETNIFIESYAQGWLWNIPLHTGLASVGAVVDSGAGRRELLRHGPRGFLMRQIADAPHTAAMLADAKLSSGPFVVRDWSYLSERMAGDGYVLVGDAACFVDPLFSSGVHMALMSGVLAAAYVTTALKNPGMRDAAGRVYEELYRTEYDHFRELAKLFYSSNRTVESYFWEARRLLDAGDDRSPREAFISALAGQPPRGYERVALERGEPPPDVVAGVRAVESRRAERRAKLESGGASRAALLAAVPRLAPDARVERKPVIAEGEFVWSHVLTTHARREGIPCSGVVAGMVSLMDGRASVAELLARLCEDYREEQRSQVASAALNALRLLYVDGVVEELAGM